MNRHKSIVILKCKIYKGGCYLKNDVSVISLFDGISCGRLAFDRAGIKVGSYKAFEIDKYAKAISRYNYPDIKQCGDVLDTDFSQFAGADFVIGGSPCTFWSIAKNNRETDKNGIGWELFVKFIEAVKIVKPKYFLYENVASMPKTIKEYITEEFETEPIMINSALVSAQQRKRLYWTNISKVKQPYNKGILLNDILENAVAWQDKSCCITEAYSEAFLFNTPKRKQRTIVAESIKSFQYDNKNIVYEPITEVGAALRTRRNKAGNFKHLEVRKDYKLNSLTTVLTDSMICQPIRVGTVGKGGQGERVYSVYGKTICMSANGGGKGAKTGLYKIDLPDGDYIIRKLTPVEAERSQTLPDNYTCFGIDDMGKKIRISNTQRYKCIGNGWTVDVIAHILSFTKNNINLSNNFKK